jgi:serine/threonine protein kinase
MDLPWEVFVGPMDLTGHVSGGPLEDDESLPEQIGSYLVKRRLGRGGGGIVYLVYDPSLDRELALKVLPDHVARDPAELERLTTEAKILARVPHENIVTVILLDEFQGKRFIVMEYVPGTTIAEKLRAGPLRPREAVEICRKVASALECAHAKEVVHRDLKPANIQIAVDGKVKVLDFGIARGVPARPLGEVEGAEGLAETSAAAGTPGYMSPEVLRGESASSASDVFAFGCVLYECLSGNAAFPGKSRRERMEANCDCSPDWTRLRARRLRALRALVKRCMDPVPSQRPSISEVCQELDRASLGRRSWARPSALVSVVLIVFLLAVGYSRPTVRGTEQGIEGRVPVIGCSPWKIRHDAPVDRSLINTETWTSRVIYGLEPGGSDGGSLFVRDRRTGKLLWDIRPDYAALRDLFGEQRAQVGSYRCRSIQFGDLDGDGEMEVIGRFCHEWWFPTYVVICRADGSRMGTYHSMGVVYEVLIKDIDGDGKDEILLAATNNSPAYQGATVILLDDQFCNGASVDPIAHPACSWQDSSRARVVFPAFDEEFMDEFSAERLTAENLSLAWDRNGEPLITFDVMCDKASIVVTLDGDLVPLSYFANPLRPHVKDWPAPLRERFLSSAYLDEWFDHHRLLGAIHPH